jgi:hypothetical protein
MNENNKMQLSFTWAHDPIIHRLTQLLENMEVPAMRRDLNKPSNIRWLLRNVAANNTGPEVHEVIALLVKEQRRLK